MKQQGWRLVAKRALDATVAGAGLVVAAPLMAGISAAILATMGRPVFFIQDRPGFRGRIFRMVKFRTMANASSSRVDPERDALRLTPLGRFLRETSLDELPELWNVLRGEMSLVGPRPLIVAYLERYTPEQARRHDVLPGLTGWAQINGRNATTWEERFANDLYYVDHWSLGLDLRILARTAGAVLFKKGISHEGHASMPEYFPTPQEKP